MGFFSRARDMYALQKQTKSIKKELKNIHIEAEGEGVTVVVTGEQEFLSVTVKDVFWSEVKNNEHGKKHLEEAFLKAINRAIKKAQEISGTKMKGVWDQLGVVTK